MHDLMKSRPAATAAVSHSLSHSPSRLPLGAESTHLQPGGNGRRALKLRDCNAWSPVAYADMQVCVLVGMACYLLQESDSLNITAWSMVIALIQTVLIIMRRPRAQLSRRPAK